MQLGEALTNAAFRTAREDQRMTPISASELPYLNIDVTLLGPFKKIEAEGSERAQAVYIGKHGLMIQRGDKTGLLLPSVATERGWNAERFLQAVCSKAGLPIGAWESSDTTIMTFQGETLSSPLSELLPVNFQTLTTPPLLPEQVSAYARIAGENIVALLTGGTPSYVIPHLPDVNVNAVVLSMQWGVDVHAEDQQRGNALQVSFRPGVALQSTLYQMCQQAAQLFQQQRFNGQLQLGLTLGFDPAMHGYGENADLEGVDPSQRAIIISDARHCGLYYDPQQSPLELLATLRKALPVSSREGVVHSMTVVSTMPRVMSISVPSPVVAHGARPPAVAGKFYPAEDAARRAMVDKLVDTTAITQVAPLAIMVPHAGLKYSGAVAANVWRRVRDLNESTLLVISPKHTLAGVNWSVCPFDSWNLSSKVSFAADRELAQQIAEHVKELQLDAAAHQGEHGIEVQLPILEKLAPQAQVVGVALHGGSWQDIQQAAAELADLLQRLEKRPLLVISSDMNHYAPEMENRRRDRMALDALATGDPQHLLRVCRENDISMCGVVPAALVMETLHRLGVEFRVEEVDYTTSAEASGDKSQVVGYAGALFLPAAPVLS
jgi:AmmeMemoRadiSam system protein B